jgi:phosphatidylglycerophosphate synthase
MSKTNPHTADAAVLVYGGLSRAQSQGAALLVVLAVVVFAVARLLDPADGLMATALPVSLFLATGVGALHAMSTFGYARATFGLPNAITLLRLALVCALSAAFFLDQPLTQAGPFLFGIAALALCLDGLDGWLARRHGSHTAFGARFDMEVDAGLACMLSLILIADGRVGAAVLILGFSRYVFVAAALVWPWLSAPLPERLGRKVVCVIQIATLCLLLLPALPLQLANALALFAAAMLLWSFGRDIVYLARHR